MSALGVDLVTALKADAALVALVGTKMYPSLMPQGTVTPALVYQVVSDLPENALTGSAVDRLTGSRVQVDCYATTYVAAHAVADAVDAVLSSLSTPALSAWREVSRDLYDNETQLHRVSMDFGVWR